MSIAIFVLAFVAPPTITAAAGTGEKGYSGDGGLATKAKLNNPFDILVQPFPGYVIFSDTDNHCVRRVDSHGIITTIAGCGKKGYTGDGGPATQATFNEPYGLASDLEGHLYIVDRLNFCVRKVDGKTGIITTIAGTGKSGNSPDGAQATDAHFVEANGICFAGEHMLYVTDVKAQKVRSIDLKTGVIGTLVGTGEKKTVDGPLDKASCQGPRAIDTEGPDTILLAEREGHCIRRIDLKKKTITKIAGTGKGGYTGDGGPALAATFNGPKAITTDKDHNIFVCDTENEAIRRIDAKSGIVTTVAGKGRTKTPGLGDGGDPLHATLGRPHGVAIGAAGELYIGDTLSHRIRVVRP